LNQNIKEVENKGKSIVGAVILAGAGAVGVLVTQQPHPINLRSNELQAVIVHTSAEPEGRDTRAYQLDDYFKRPRSKGGKGWSKCGYNDIIELSGKTVNTVPYNDDSVQTFSELAYGACEYNRIARNVCYVGGMNRSYTAAKNTLTPAQDSALAMYLYHFLQLHPRAWIIGHNQLPGVKKACPSFDVPIWLRAHGFPEQNIYKKPLLSKKNEKIYNNIAHKLASDSI
jgi:N-acetylmuramoyl-L-alanine amidase